MSQPDNKKRTTSEVIQEMTDDYKRHGRIPDEFMMGLWRELMNGGLVNDVEPDPGCKYDPTYAHDDIYECNGCGYAGSLNDVTAEACPGCKDPNAVWIHNIERAGKMKS